MNNTHSSASTFHKLQWNIIDHKEQNKTYFWTYSFFTSIISFFGAHRKDILLRDLWCKLGSFNKCTWQKQHKRMHDENETNGKNGLKKLYYKCGFLYVLFSLNKLRKVKKSYTINQLHNFCRKNHIYHC